MSTTELTKLRNIGATVAKCLNEIGVFSRHDLERIGPVFAYQKMKRLNPDATLPRCYYLYSLEGALRNVHWDDLPQSIKQRLSIEAGLEEE
jgi:DNA transformation protein